MAQPITGPRQVVLKRCLIYSPGMEQRASAEDAVGLEEQGFNILPIVSKIDIFESIFDNTVSGAITLNDTVGLTEYLPLVGVEFLAVTFAVTVDEQEREFKHVFRVAALRDQTFDRNEHRNYTLDLVTPEFMASVSGRVTRSFTDQSTKDAVVDILTNHLAVSPNHIITLEETDGRLTTTIPNYTPLQAINYFTMLSLTKTTPKESNFLFFETLDGFHFVSVRELMRRPPTKVFDVNTSMVSGMPTMRSAPAFNSINKLHQEQSFDVLNDIVSGMMRSRTLRVDFLARQWSEVDSRYSETFPQTTHMGRFPVYPHNFDLSVDKNVKLFVIPTNNWSAGSTYVKQSRESLTPQKLHETIMLRNRQLRELQHIKTVLEIPGQPDLRAGDTVTVNYPSTRVLQQVAAPGQQPQPNLPSKYYSGTHLVSAVRHIIERTGLATMEYHMHVEVVRDALSAPLIGFSE